MVMELQALRVRRVADCRWGTPSRANWGDLFGADTDLPPQWVTRNGFALDRRNGAPTHWMPRPPGPSIIGPRIEPPADSGEAGRG